MSLRTRYVRVLLLGFTLVVSACDTDSSEAESGFLGLLEGRGNFSILIETLQQTGLDAGIEQGEYTIFAPTDQAFRALGPETLESLRAPDAEAILTDVLEAHIVPGAVQMEDMQDGDRLPTLEGRELEVSVVGERVSVNGLELRRALTSSGGLVYAVEGVYRDHLSIAERLKISDLLSILRRALDEAALLDDLGSDGPFTLFVPINDAFELLGEGATQRLLNDPVLLEKVVENHIVTAQIESSDIADGQAIETMAGGSLVFSRGEDGLRVDGARVLLPDVPASNGVIHLVESVLTSDLTLNEVAVLAGLESWLDALEVAGLEGLLNDEGPYTVFVPSNFGFADFDVAFAHAEGLLERVLKFHVVPGLFPSSEFGGELTLPTLEGDEMRVSTLNGQTLVGFDALSRVIDTDIVARNGVMHIVAGVLNPSLSLFEGLVFEGRERFVRLSQRIGLDSPLQDEGPFTVFAFTDEAFITDPRAAILQDPGNEEMLESYLRYHIAEGYHPPASLALSGEFPTLFGSPLPYDNVPRVGIFVGADSILAVGAEIEPTNGALYEIEEILTPPGY